MGTATIEVYPQVLLELRKHDVRVLSSHEMGDGTLLCKIESEKLPAGYNGQVDVILGPTNYSAVWFRRTTDV